MASLLGKGFDPNHKYKVVLSQRLLNSSKNSYAISSVQLDRDLKLPHAVRNATLSPGFGSKDCELSLTGAADGKELSYSGSTSNPKTYALIFDQAAGTFTLESIDTRYAFTTDNENATSGEQSEAALLNTLIEEEGAPEEDNPFDWRHQLKRQRTPSPDIEPFRLDTGATASPIASPIVQPARSRVRQASTPPGENLDFEEDPSPERPTQEAEQDTFEIGGEESEEEGGLEISYDGAYKQPSKSGYRRGRGAQRSAGGPIISLRSAANSRSPAIGNRSESDEDVDMIQLGSPHRETGSATQNGVDDAAELEEFESALAAVEDIDEYNFEAEFTNALEANDEDEAPAPTSQNYVMEDSSSESEEE